MMSDINQVDRFEYKGRIFAAREEAVAAKQRDELELFLDSVNFGLHELLNALAQPSYVRYRFVSWLRTLGVTFPPTPAIVPATGMAALAQVSTLSFTRYEQRLLANALEAAAAGIVILSQLDVDIERPDQRRRIAQQQCASLRTYYSVLHSRIVSACRDHT